LVRPYAVDVSTGVESSPGVKSAEKMRNFIERVREERV
jgi:phosphoribosylanthranilate isomerase